MNNPNPKTRCERRGCRNLCDPTKHKHCSLGCRAVSELEATGHHYAQELGNDLEAVRNYQDAVDFMIESYSAAMSARHRIRRACLDVGMTPGEFMELSRGKGLKIGGEQAEPSSSPTRRGVRGSGTSTPPPEIELPAPQVTIDELREHYAR